MWHYAGIGSRKTPGEILVEMERYGEIAARRHHVLRSGHGRGADTAFEIGCDKVAGRKKIYRTADVENRPDALAHAARYHPAWNHCQSYAQLLHARNSLIILGDDLQTSVECIVCWTPNGAITGGTGQALRIAEDWRIPVFNLAITKDRDTIREWLDA